MKDSERVVVVKSINDYNNIIFTTHFKVFLFVQ